MTSRIRMWGAACGVGAFVVLTMGLPPRLLGTNAWMPGISDLALFVGAGALFVAASLGSRCLPAAIRWSADHPRIVLFALVGLTLLAAPGIPNLSFVRIFDAADLPPGHRDVGDYRQYVEWRGEENSFLITLHHQEDVFSPRVVAELARLEDEIRGLPSVHADRILSLASARVVLDEPSIGDGVAGKRIATFAEVATELHEREANRQLRMLAERHPLVHKRLVSENGRTAVIQVQFDPNGDLVGLYRGVQDLAADRRPTTGNLRDFVARIMGFDTDQLGATGFVLVDMACLLAILFVATIVATAAWFLMGLFLGRAFGVLRGRRLHARRLSPLLFTLGPLTLAPILLVMGTLGWIGIPVDTVTGVIPIVFIAVAASYGVHLADYIHRAPGGEAHSRLVNGVTRIARPLGVAAATTAIGFATLMPFEISSVARFGTWAAIGVFALMMPIALLVGPAWFALWPLSQDPAEPPPEIRALRRPTTATLPHQRPVLAIAGTVGVFALILIPSLEIGSQPTRFLHPDSLIPQTTNLLNAQFGANGALLVAVDSGTDGAALAPELLRRTAALSAYAENLHQVAFVQDLPQILSYLNSEFLDTPGLPVNAALARQLVFLYEMAGGDLVLVDRAQRRSFLNIWGDFERSTDVREVADAIRDQAGKLGLNVAVGSEFLLWVAQTDYLVTGKVVSWLQALLLVTLLAALAYRSLRAPLAIGGAVLLVTVVILGLMALLDIPLDIASTVITSMTIGVCADFAIHMVDAFDEIAKAGGRPEDAILRALSPILIDAESNIVGFSAFWLSPLLPVRHAGMMLMISMVLGALAALYFVPAVLQYQVAHRKDMS